MESYGIMFHHLHGGVYPKSQGSISTEQLARIIEHYQRLLLPAQQWADRALAGTLKNEICLTFDDNLRCQFDLAYPVLRRYRLTGFWFVSTAIFAGQPDLLEVYHRFRNEHFPSLSHFYRTFFAAAGHESTLRDFNPAAYLIQYPFYTGDDRRFRYLREEVMSVAEYDAVMATLIAERGLTVAALSDDLWLTPDQLQALHREGHVIGLHSHTHPMDIKRLEAAAQRHEYRQNIDMLTHLLGVEPFALSHPCGSYSQQTLNVLSALGITVGFRDTMTAGPTTLEYPRQDSSLIVKQLDRI